MTSTLSPRNRRALRIAGIAVLVFAVLRLVVSPLISSIMRLRDQLLQESSALAAERELLRAPELLPAAAEAAIAADEAATPLAFAAATTAAAEAQFAEILEGAAEHNSVALLQRELLPARPGPDGLNMLSMRVHAESDLIGALELLAELSRGQPAVRVAELTLEVHSPQIDDGSAEETPERLEIGFTATAYYAPRAWPLESPSPSSGAPMLRARTTRQGRP